jgi:hypothetical protein
MKQIHDLPAMKNLPVGISELTFGQAKWQAEMVKNFIVAVVGHLPGLRGAGAALSPPAAAAWSTCSRCWCAARRAARAAGSGNPVSMPVYIGILMLFGIVAKNSILLIDFALEEMAQGCRQVVAIIDAGHKRAQPIVMTTVAMVAGMVPTALSLSGDSSWRAPMGIVVIGGLILSTVLTLLIVPALASAWR